MFSSKKCPSCGAKNPKGSIACTKCGAPLALGQSEEQLRGRDMAPPARADQKVCPECGSANPSLRSTCVSCGAWIGRKLDATTTGLGIWESVREMVTGSEAPDDGPRRPEATAWSSPPPRAAHWWRDGLNREDRSELKHDAVYDFAEGPIRWVNVWYIPESSGPGGSSGPWYYYYYGVPDPRVADIPLGVEIDSSQKRNFIGRASR